MMDVLSGTAADTVLRISGEVFGGVDATSTTTLESIILLSLLLFG